jgi:hypothetical protein
MTLVQFFVNFLRPYKDMPEFTSCVMKALEKLGHAISGESMYQKPAKSCQINDKTLQKDLFCDD